MIGKIIGAFVGDKVAKKTGSMGGASGAALGVVASTVLKRLSLPAMIVLGAGGYAAKKLIDKGDAAKSTSDAGTRKPPKTSTAPEPPVKKAASAGA